MPSQEKKNVYKLNWSYMYVYIYIFMFFERSLWNNETIKKNIYKNNIIKKIYNNNNEAITGEIGQAFVRMLFVFHNFNLIKINLFLFNFYNLISI